MRIMDMLIAGQQICERRRLMSKKSIGSRTLKAGAALLAVGAGVAAINAKE